MPSLDPAIAALFRRQHGVAAVRQLVDLGASRKVVSRRVAGGEWVRADAKVIRLAGVVATWESQLLTHVLSAGDGAVASHRAAAVLWSLDGCRRCAPEVTVPRERRYRREGIRVHQSGDLDRVTAVRRSGIPTTPIERTLLDLGAVAPRNVVLLAADDARRRGRSPTGTSCSIAWCSTPGEDATASAPCGPSSKPISTSRP